MRIIPVMDVKGGMVVHAKAGDRERYQPIKSVLTPSTNPVEVANAFKKLGARELYIADLDAIEKRGSNLKSVLEIKKLGFDILLDSGISTARDVKDLADVGSIVVGTETLQSLDELEKMTETCEIVLSLDFKGGELLTRIKELKNLDAEDLIKIILSYDHDIKRWIYLDLKRVGTSCGMREDRIKKMVKSIPMPLLVGGGINSISDIRRMQTIGVSGVLVATAIHNGRITKEDICGSRYQS
ncbi:MAG: HisA/HisF family protein [Methanocellales archaeon]|nr:HisA/HisF family protein [Methanocellales archaeon]MDD3291337.1 HisA/HisF family protein [Methanocellales archaeon]MDD5235831.1 HisA/HisF family protein [Methanocellales archaeon]MDD5484408.1 HisA/HisF family protein [Methanocellales archaeon]